MACLYYLSLCPLRTTQIEKRDWKAQEAGVQHVRAYITKNCTPGNGRWGRHKLSKRRCARDNSADGCCRERLCKRYQISGPGLSSGPEQNKQARKNCPSHCFPYRKQVGGVAAAGRKGTAIASNGHPREHAASFCGDARKNRNFKIVPDNRFGLHQYPKRRRGYVLALRERPWPHRHRPIFARQGRHAECSQPNQKHTAAAGRAKWTHWWKIMDRLC